MLHPLHPYSGTDIPLSLQNSASYGSPQVTVPKPSPKISENERENLHMILLCKKGSHGVCVRESTKKGMLEREGRERLQALACCKILLLDGEDERNKQVPEAFT